MIDSLDRFFSRLSAFVAILGGLGLLFATVVTCVSILLKLGGRILQTLLGSVPENLGFMRSILGEEELVTYGVGLALFASLPWVMIAKGHIKIDLFESVFGERFNRILDFLGDLALAFLAYLILTRQWFLVFRAARRSEEGFVAELMNGNWAALGERLRDSQESQILGVKLWPTYIVAEICVLVFFVVACFCVIRSFRDMLHPSRARV